MFIKTTDKFVMQNIMWILNIKHTKQTQLSILEKNYNAILSQVFLVYVIFMAVKTKLVVL